MGELRAYLSGAHGIWRGGFYWDAIFFLLLVAFLLGSLFFGLAAVCGRRLKRWLGWLYLLAVPLTLAIMLGGYTRIAVFDPLVAWIYPILQPVSRALLACWLWMEGRSAGVARSATFDHESDIRAI